MKQLLTNTQLLEGLNQRYAVKQFDKQKSTDLGNIEQIVKDILTLTPTSFGLQGYKFVIVTDEAKREELRAASWNQTQVVDANMYVVFCVPTNFSKSHIEKHVDHMKAVRGYDDAKRDGLVDFMHGAIIENGEALGIGNTEEWLTRQLYIALGNAMTSLALLGLDTCPLEGLDPSAYNKILDLDGQNLTAKVGLAIGARSSEDKYQSEQKVRFDQSEIFITI